MLKNQVVFEVTKDINVENIFEPLIEYNPDAITILDIMGKVVYTNHASLKILGYEKEQIINSFFSDFVFREDQLHLHKIFKFITSSKHQTSKIQLRIADKYEYIHTIEAKVAHINVGEERLISLTYYDISDQKEMEKEIQHLTYEDAFNGIANPVFFFDRFKKSIANARRNKERLAIALVDLEVFQNTMDTNAEKLNQELLREVSQKIVKGLRETDTVGRQGCNTFSILITEVSTNQDIVTVISKVMKNISDINLLNENKIIIKPSIGIATFPSDSDDPGQLLLKAEVALNIARYHGGNKYYFFNEEISNIYNDLKFPS